MLCLVAVGIWSTLYALREMQIMGPWSHMTDPSISRMPLLCVRWEISKSTPTGLMSLLIVDLLLPLGVEVFLLEKNYNPHLMPPGSVHLICFMVVYQAAVFALE